MIYVAVFNMTQYKCTLNRVSKPFNPMLGETFEIQRPDYRFIAEQVQHHPPVSACFAQNNQKDYQYFMNTNYKTQFWGGSIEVIPLGLCHSQLNAFQEEYIVNRPSSIAQNIIFGNMYIEHCGTLHCQKVVEGGQPVPEEDRMSMTLEFKKSGWTNKNWGVVEGQVPVRPGSKYNWRVYGKWFEGMKAFNEETGQEIVIWQPSDNLPNSAFMYNFTRFGVNLNYLPPDLKALLPPTDSRFRPDQRALEEGQIEKAIYEKNRLEELQRKARRERQAQNIEWKPRYFEKFVDPVTENIDYTYCRDYWADRASQHWEDCPDLFHLDSEGEMDNTHDQ